jgi:hypothetical protein
VILECDGCGKLVHAVQVHCGACGEPLDIPPVSTIGNHPDIPILRYGTIPAPPDDIWVVPPAVRRRRKALAVLAGLAAAGVSAWAGWPL